jgi:hypothetical protein
MKIILTGINKEGTDKKIPSLALHVGQLLVAFLARPPVRRILFVASWRAAWFPRYTRTRPIERRKGSAGPFDEFQVG